MTKIKIDKNYSMMVSLFSLFIFLFSFVIFSCDNPLIQRIVEPKTATFESNGGSHVENQTVFKGQPVRRPQNPARSGFAFDAWYSDDETFQEEWDFSAIPNRDITLYAKWNPVSVGVETFTVTFNSNGGDRDASPPRRTVESGSLVTPPDENPMRDSFEFGGWYTDAECTDGNEWDFETDTVSGDISLYAKWVEIAGVEYFTVTFNSNGGETDASPPDRRVASGTRVTAPEPPRRTGYTVSGWYREAECVNEWDFAADTVSADITLYAKWDISRHTVTFIADGGTPAPQAQSIAHGGKADAPAAMDKPGYTFIGWYTEAEGGRQWVFAEDAVSGDITLYAKWETIPGIDYFTVTFNSGGGTTVPVQIVASGGKASEPQGVTKDGYTLAGWFRDNNTFQNQWNFATDTVSADITLYAKWETAHTHTYSNTWSFNEIQHWRECTAGDGAKSDEAAHTGSPCTVCGYWRWTAVADSTIGTDYAIYAIAYGNNTWVAGGYDGTMVYSTDGASWTAVADSTFGTSEIYAIAYDNNRFVAGGNSGKMAYSADGVTWTAIANSTFAFSIRAIAYGNNMFVAVGHSGKMAYSSDGVTWTAVTNSPFRNTNSDSINAIAYGNNRFVAGGRVGEMAYSADGITWTAVADSPFGSSNDIKAIAYGNGRFVVGGEYGRMVYSADGVTGTVVSGTNSTFSGTNITAIAYGNGTFVAGGRSNKMAYSADGITWTAVADNTFGTSPYSEITAIAYGNGRFVAVGDDGKMAYSGDYVAPATRTVTFNSNGGSTVSPLTSVTHGSTITAPAEPNRNGYTFGGWYKESTLTTPWNFQTDTVSADITLYAKWVEITISASDFYAQVAAYGSATSNVTIAVPNDITLDTMVTIPANTSGATLTITSANPANPRILFRGFGGTAGTTPLFLIENNALLIFKDIIVDGRKNDYIENNYGALVRINSGGSVTMENGAVLRNNTNTDNYGGGVYVGNGATFTMTGGEISGNNSINRSPAYEPGYGGGVYVSGGATFTMNNGKISGNTISTISSSSYIGSLDGGGVYVSGNDNGPGIFIMNGGEISGNVLDGGGGTSYGGGVYVSGIFTMNSGKISDNTASNTTGSSLGGGVYVSGTGTRGTFTMNGGEISGNTASNTDSRSTVRSCGGGVCISAPSMNSTGIFTMTGGKIFDNTASSASSPSYGGGVYVTGVAGSNTSFTITGGEIFGNTASSASSSSYGGGIYMSLPTADSYYLRIVTGTVYGSDASAGLKKNTASDGAALYLDSEVTAQRGRFSIPGNVNSTWTSRGNLTTTDNTVDVLNGDFVP